MATAIESPSLASAREKAASILYGQTPSVTSVVAELDVPVDTTPEPKTTTKARPTFTAYHPAEPVRAVARPTQFRKYEVVEEPTYTREPQVLRPFVNNQEYFQNLTNETEVATTTTDTTEYVAPAAVTTKTVTSEIDQELEDDTQYVVRLKPATVVAATVLATIFLVMAVLFVVNIVNLVGTSATVNAMLVEEQTLNQTLQEHLTEIETARKTAIAANSGSNNHITTTYLTADQITEYVPEATAAAGGSFFDWVCKALSNLFG